MANLHVKFEAKGWAPLIKISYDACSNYLMSMKDLSRST